jgi:acetoacetate decarboxylase
LSLNAHALAPVAELPVLEVVSTTHLLADLTLGLGKVVYDYMDLPDRRGSVARIGSPRASLAGRP